MGDDEYQLGVKIYWHFFGWKIVKYNSLSCLDISHYRFLLCVMISSHHIWPYLPIAALCHRVFSLSGLDHVSLPQLRLLLICCCNDCSCLTLTIIMFVYGQNVAIQWGVFICFEEREVHDIHLYRSSLKSVTGDLGDICNGRLSAPVWSEEISDWRCNLWPEVCLKCKNNVGNT